MKTNVRETSLQCYREAYDRLQKCERMILQAIINLRRPTRREIAAYLGWEASSVSGRVFGLMHPMRNGRELPPIVIENGKRKCKITGKTSAMLCVVGAPDHNNPTVIIEPTGQTVMVF